MTKSQFVATISEKAGVSKKEVASVWEAMVGVVYDSVKKEGELMLPGLGKLVKKHRPERMGRNPATGEQIKIGAKTVVKFRVAKAAKDSIL